MSKLAWRSPYEIQIYIGVLNRISDKIRDVVDPDQINQASLAQPLNTAIQIALIDLLDSWNIKAAVFVGHSSGRSYSTRNCSKRQLTLM